MNDSIEFTPKEKYQISLYQDPEGLARRAVVLSLCYLVPSIGLVAFSFVSGDIPCGVIGYGILVYVWVYKIYRYKDAYLETAAIFKKYEAQLQRKEDGGGHG